MKRYLALFVLMVLLAGCQRSPEGIGATATTEVRESAAEEETPNWSVYDPDPGHPWNEVFRQLYGRSATDGEVYGADELDPLLWFDTTYLLTGDSHQEAIQVLDDFLASHAEYLIQDPLKRAMFQRDLWAVFDWAASQAEPNPDERAALQVRLAEIMQRVALTREQILALPDNYKLAVGPEIYPSVFEGEQSQAAFLPPDLFQSGGAWVPMGREGGPAAMTHTEAFPFFGRSVFLVFARAPDGREATLEFIESLNTEPNPVTAAGSEVALVRRMLLIDQQGQLVLSPLVETVQLRHFSPVQSFYEFELERKKLFAGIAGGLVPNEDLFLLFMGHGDVFEHQFPELQAAIPHICKACHASDSQISGSGNTQSIVTYSREPFALPDQEQPILFRTTIQDEAETVVEWKRAHSTWQSLETLWVRIRP